MKTIKNFIIIVAFLLQSIFLLQAQTTAGTKFWLTFGKNANYADLTYQPELGIRIAAGDSPANVSLSFTDNQTFVNFSVAAHQVYTYNLNVEQKYAAYNTIMGTSNHSILITSDALISVYVLNYATDSSDATNILPETALGTEYYQISYPSVSYPLNMYDAYAVVATQNNTVLSHNEEYIATLDSGQVYYKTSSTDMTGAHITSNYPVAFFAVNQRASVPFTNLVGKCLIQQLAPVNTWDNIFFVPVTIFPKNIVRIVVSENNTNITQKGGIVRTDVPNAQTVLTHLQAGQFVELDIHLDSVGCYIQADKPVGICAYMTNFNYQVGTNTSYPAQCWIPGINQSVSNVLISPFVPNYFNYLDTHHALVVTQTATKNSTLVSIGGAAPDTLQGGSWRDNVEAGTSFYIMPLTNNTASYLFSNPKGLIILGYGFCSASVLQTYYYLAGSAMRDLQAAFYANDIHCGDLENNQICEKEVFFRAEIENMSVEIDSIKWYIDDDDEYLPAQNQETWNKNFTQGEYKITLVIYYFENGETKTKTITGTLKRKDLWIKMRNIKH